MTGNPQVATLTAISNPRPACYDPQPASSDPDPQTRKIANHYGKTTYRNLIQTETSLKHELKIETEKLRRRKTLQERRSINRMFKFAPKRVYQSMKDQNSRRVKDMPERSEVNNFWMAL